MLILYVVAILLECSHAAYANDEDDSTFHPRMATTEDVEFEPEIPLTKDKEKFTAVKNINCEEFAKYAKNCTFEAALMYNSSQKSPPMPTKIFDWCKAIRHLTNCAIDWNSDCKDVTDSHFNEESIRGHMHVVNNICDDEWFLERYDILPLCIEGASTSWEKCYTAFKRIIDEEKNTTHEWTHFDTHFHMCCARAKFRRCTLDALYELSEVCPYDQAITLQKFTVVISEGDVYQDCDTNMMYVNCPGGDPRPSGSYLAKMMNGESFVLHASKSLQNRVSVDFNYFVFLVICELLK